MEGEDFLRRAPSRRRSSVQDKAQVASAQDSPHKLISGLSTEEREKLNKQVYFEELVAELENVIGSMKAKKDVLVNNLRLLERRSEEMEEEENQRLITKKRLAELRALCRNLEEQRDKHIAELRERELYMERLKEQKKSLEREISLELMLEEDAPQESCGTVRTPFSPCAMWQPILNLFKQSVPGLLFILFLGVLVLVALLGWVEWDDRHYYRYRFPVTVF